MADLTFDEREWRNGSEFLFLDVRDPIPKTLLARRMPKDGPLSHDASDKQATDRYRLAQATKCSV